MLHVIVFIAFVGIVVKKLIHPWIVKLLLNGRERLVLIMRLQITVGLLLTQNHALIAK